MLRKGIAFPAGRGNRRSPFDSVQGRLSIRSLSWDNCRTSGAEVSAVFLRRLRQRLKSCPFKTCSLRFVRSPGPRMRGIRSTPIFSAGSTAQSCRSPFESCPDTRPVR